MKKSKNITVASFSFADVAKGQVALLGAGAILVCAGGLAGLFSAATAQSVSDAKGAARLLMGVSALVIQATQGYGTGSSDRMAAANSGVPALRAAMQDLRASSTSPLLPPSLSQASGQALAMHNALEAATAPMTAQATGSAEVGAVLGASRAPIAEVIKSIKDSGRAAQLGRAVESLTRLSAYADAGVGPASIAWVDYDLRIVSADLASTEYAAKLGPLATAAVNARSLAGSAPTQGQLAQLLEAASAARAAGERLGTTATGTISLPVLASISLGLIVAGLGLAAAGLLQIVRDFGRRFQRTLVQFRGEEASRESLLQSLRGHAALADMSSDMTFEEDVESSPELGEIARLVGELVARSVEKLHQLQSHVAEGKRGGESAERAVHDVQESLGEIGRRLSAMFGRLELLADRSRRLSLDASAASYSSSEAASRAADAVRVAQDGASRFDALREGLQETSKAVKRLGERTQEIDGVIDTMEQLSEQIGVLSVNASLEAERAGDAGAGFRTVAKEVQSIARRSGEALETIASLIKGAQADARAAAESVDKSTSFVVAGTHVGAVSQALLGAVVPLTSSASYVAKAMAYDGEALRDELLLVQKQHSETAEYQHRSVQAVGEATEAMSSVRVCLEAVVEA